MPGKTPAFNDTAPVDYSMRHRSPAPDTRTKSGQARSGPTFTLSLPGTSAKPATRRPARIGADNQAILGNGQTYDRAEWAWLARSFATHKWPASTVQTFFDLNHVPGFRFMAISTVRKALKACRQNPAALGEGKAPPWLPKDFDFTPPKYLHPTPAQRRALAQLYKGNPCATIAEFVQQAIEQGIVKADDVSPSQTSPATPDSEPARIFYEECKSSLRNTDFEVPRSKKSSTRRMVTSSEAESASGSGQNLKGSERIGFRRVAWPKSFPIDKESKHWIKKLLYTAIGGGWSTTEIGAALRAKFPHLQIKADSLQAVINYHTLPSDERLNYLRLLEDPSEVPERPVMPTGSEIRLINTVLRQQKLTPSGFRALAPTAFRDIDPREAFNYFMGTQSNGKSRLPEPVPDAAAVESAVADVDVDVDVDVGAEVGVLGNEPSRISDMVPQDSTRKRQALESDERRPLARQLPESPPNKKSRWHNAPTQVRFEVDDHRRDSTSSSGSDWPMFDALPDSANWTTGHDDPVFA